MIADVTETLRRALSVELNPTGNSSGPQVVAHDLHSRPNGIPPMVGLILYEVGEDPYARNRPPVKTDAGANWLVQPAPLGLMLRYMVTAWGDTNNLQTHLDAQQRLLSQVAALFGRNPVFAGPALAGALAGTDQVLRLAMYPLSMEERVRVWQAFNEKYQLALYYEVRVVNLPGGAAVAVPAVRERLLRPGLVEDSA